MITVVFATGIMNAGGAETLIMEMLRNQSNKIRYVLLIHYNSTVQRGDYDDEIKKMNIPMIYIPAVGAIGITGYIKLFKEKIRSIGIVDILHSHLNGVGGVIAKAAKGAGIKHRIIHCHADITFTGNKFSIFLNETKLCFLKYYVNKYGTEFWACSEAAGKRLFHNSKSIKVIPNVIDVARYLPNNKKRRKARLRFGFSDQLILGSVGRIARIKNYDLIIHVLADLKKQGVSVEFVCFGRIVHEEYYASLLSLAKEMEVDDQIFFMGNSDNVPEDIAAFDIFLMPSKSEGFGMAAIEAQAAGIPTLVSTGVPDAIDVGLGLVKFLPFDKDQWVDAIKNAGTVERPSVEKIIQAFDRHGLNSSTMVKEIEDEYLKMMSSKRI